MRYLEIEKKLMFVSELFENNPEFTQLRNYIAVTVFLED